MTSFGLPICESPGGEGWVVMESDQPSFRNADHAVLFWMEKVERLWGIGHKIVGYDEQTRTFESEESFREQQIWKIKIISSRSTKPVKEDDIPICTEDVASMLTGWFNHLGREHFAFYGMTNLFIMAKDINTYKDKSDANQWVTEFPLKIMLQKDFVAHVPAATLDNRGVIAVNN
ncbi:MAG: hypothetical protein J6Q22_10835 [Prevotella sp.]|nr:hypothetical protein [Prevotella sp.]